jgi:putative endonuclease
MSRDRLDKGARGEDRAVAHLRALGYHIVERNYRCKLGELDIIARDGDTLVFVEVRTRKSARYGTALETVSPAKQRTIARVAQHYLLRQPPRACRFDVIGITADELTHIVDAFRL